MRAFDPAPAWIRATADPLATSVPFGVFALAVRGAASIGDADSIDLARRKLAARLGRSLGDDAASVIETLGHAAGVPPVEPSARLRRIASDPGTLAREIRAAAIAWLRAEAREPLLVVLDDVHWADDPSMLERGELELAARLLRRSVEGVRRIGSVPMIGIALSGLARIALLRGELDLAEASVVEAFPGIGRFRLHAKPVFTIGAMVALARGDHAEARARIDRARASLAAGSHQGELMHRLDEHEVRAAIGDLEGARAALSAARAELERLAASIDDPDRRAALLRSRRAARLASAEASHATP